MDNVISSRKCRKCGSEKKEEFCDVCHKNTPTDIFIIAHDEVSVLESVGGKIKEKGKKFSQKFFSGYKPSGDPKFPKGVYVEMNVDVKNNRYDQVIMDRETGTKLHEEHESLEEHSLKQIKEINDKGRNKKTHRR